jgi:CRP-like cAMP-binding protein
MQHELDLQFIQSQIQKITGNATFPASILNEVISMIEVFHLKKFDQFLKAGEVCKYWGFVDSGLIRTFYFKKGKDVTEYFAPEGFAFTSLESIFTGKPSQLIIEALEPTVIYALSKSNVDKLCDKYHEVEILYRRILEVTLIVSQHRADSLQFETSEEKYENLLDKIPKVLLRVPSLYVASYLGITPETLSRVRAKQGKPHRTKEEEEG